MFCCKIHELRIDSLHRAACVSWFHWRCSRQRYCYRARSRCISSVDRQSCRQRYSTRQAGSYDSEPVNATSYRLNETDEEMGAHHSSHSGDRKSSAATASASSQERLASETDGDTFRSSASLCPSVSTVLCNTPYLTVMFERLVDESVSVDGSVKSGTVSRLVLEKTFNGPLKVLGRLLYDYMCRAEPTDSGSSSRRCCDGSGSSSGCQLSSLTAAAAADESRSRAAGAAGSTVDCRCFLRIATEVLSLLNVQQQLNYYYGVFASSPKTGMTEEEVRQMVMSCFSVALTSAYLPYEPTAADSRILDAFISSLFAGTSSTPDDDRTEPRLVRQESFVAWCARHCPNLFNGVHCFLVMKLSGWNSSSSSDGWHRRTGAPQADGAAEPVAGSPTSGDSGVGADGGLPHSSSTPGVQLTAVQAALAGTPGEGSALCLSVLWLLSCALPAKYIAPLPQTSSGHVGNGSSSGARVAAGTATAAADFMPSFLVSKLHQVVEHNGWSLLYNSDQHGLSTNRFETHVFSYKGPSIAIITFESHVYVVGADDEWRESMQRWGGDDCVLVQILPRFGLVQAGADLLYLNHHNRGGCKGMQIGKDARHVVLQIDDMTNVKYYGTAYSLEHLEVWGCAGPEATEHQVRQRQWEHKEAEKLSNRKLKLESWEENPDRQLLSWAGINTNHAQKA